MLRLSLVMNWDIIISVGAYAFLDTVFQPLENLGRNSSKESRPGWLFGDFMNDPEEK